MPKQLTPLQQKKAAQDAAQMQITLALKRAQELKKEQILSSTKRKQGHELQLYIAPELLNHAIRNPFSFTTRTYNLSRQVREFTDHMFTQYPVAECLYPHVYSDIGFKEVYDRNRVQETEEQIEISRHWFLTLARGESFTKATKDHMTRKEAHEFLSSPSYLTLPQAICRARCIVAGVPGPIANILAQKATSEQLERLGSRFNSLVQFFAMYGAELRRGEPHELIDFLLISAEDVNFTLRGRSLNAIRRLSTQWHRNWWYKSGYLTMAWEPTFAVWQRALKDQVVMALDLSSGRELSEEGLAQRHCVSSYSPDCEKGMIRIVSMRWLGSRDELTKTRKILRRVTLEISLQSKTVNQIRGKANRLPTEMELEVVRLWAEANRIKVAEWAY